MTPGASLPPGLRSSESQGMKRLVAEAIAAIEAPFDALRREAKARLGWCSAPVILPFNTYGHPGAIHVAGRVLEDDGVLGAEPDSDVWSTVRNMYYRYETDEVPDTEVDILLGDERHRTRTDDEGYFSVVLDGDGLDLDVEDGWLHVDVQLPDRDHIRQAKVRMIPRDTKLAVVTDVDDTIVRTGATDRLRSILTIALNNARSREPFPGMAAFFRALTRQENDDRPLIYLSSSPWNLYDLFEDFLEIHGFPSGPIQLRDLGVDRHSLFGDDHHAHKRTAILRFLSTFPELRLVLLGDTGQQDGLIYRDIVERHPDRVEAVYLRDVAPNAEHLDGVKECLLDKGVGFIRASSTKAMAKDALERGLISPADCDAVVDAISNSQRTEVAG